MNLVFIDDQKGVLEKIMVDDDYKFFYDDFNIFVVLCKKGKVKVVIKNLIDK